MMNWKKIILVVVLANSVVLSGFHNPDNDSAREFKIMDAVFQFLKMYHFDPVELNDDFSQKAFDNYLKNLDHRKRFLLQSEVDQLMQYRLLVDDQIANKSMDLFNLSEEIIDNSRERAQRIFHELMRADIDQTVDGSIEMDGEKRSYAKDEEELKSYWKQMLQYDLNNRLENKISKQEERKELEAEKALDDIVEDTEVEKEPIKTKKELRTEAVNAMNKSYDKWFKRLDQDKRSDKFSRYVNSLTGLFDPHSDYMSPRAKQDFDIRMGGKLEGIGARLQIEDEYTKVSSIVPGGPAWKGKELKEDDLITAVKQEGEEPVSVIGWRLSDVVDLIRGKKGTTVTLTTKKPDGTITDISIERDVVNIDDSFARSLLLDIPNVIKNVGYIRLPKFYSSFEKEDGNSCAQDVKKEIEKLKEVNVNAIILDLRGNGGGSLNDVVDMSGLFIEDGPIVQVKPRHKEAYLYEDKDEEVHYNGPLVIMVNQFSASASEIIAAAMQDYGRAVIVGSKSTFGKGTVQRILDLDRMFRNEDANNLGNLKITMQKFFRVNGGSTQLRGVIPDIILPDEFQYIDTGEKDYDYAMEWTSIDPVEHKQSVYNVPSIKELDRRSKIRTAENEDFKLIEENAQRLKTNRDVTSYPLDFVTYTDYIEKKDQEAEKFKSLYEEDVKNLLVKNLSSDQEYITYDESRIERNKDWVEGVQKDFYLEEVMYILKDMLELQPSFTSASDNK